jgi:hypothetical protein
MVLSILGKKGIKEDPVQIAKMMKAMVVTETDDGYKASIKGGFRLHRFLTASEMDEADALVKSLMGGDPSKQMMASMGPEMSAYLAQVSPTQKQAQAKTAVLNQSAAAQSAAAGQGGDTNITVVSPTTSNSSTTVQNIGTNDMNSSNPRPTSNLTNW